MIPFDWKIGKILPVHKFGGKSSPFIYRPISLTCMSFKILKHIIYKHLINLLDSSDFFSSMQHGFCEQLSCETQLNFLTNDLFQIRNSGCPTNAFHKVPHYNKVPHYRLLSKLSSLKQDQNALKLIEFFLSYRS